MKAVKRLTFALDAQWRRCGALLQECRVECSEASVHDLRIALRRVLVSLKLAQVLVPDAGIQKLRRMFKRQLDSFDELRDIHVMLAEISNRTERFPELGLLRSHLEKREKQRLRAAGVLIRAFKVRSAIRGISKIVASMAELQEGDVSARIIQSADEAYSKIICRYAMLDKARISSFHRVRVAFKKFRYLMESVHPLVPHFPEDNLKRMRRYQTRLGKIQDADVLLQALAGVARSSRAGALKAPLRFYELRRTAAVSAYLKNSRDVFTFWKVKPHSS